MQKVPIDKILIQPTVQYSWLLQHRSIEFSLPATLLVQFSQLWSLYQASAPISVVDFLNENSVAGFELHQNDLLFALFTGAQYAKTQNNQFEVTIIDQKMIWRIGS